MDEADTFLLGHEGLRGVMNSGHTRATGFVQRASGAAQGLRVCATWGARMLALLGRLPATLEDRAIVLPMRRRAPGEPLERLRREHLASGLEPLRRRAARWGVDHEGALQGADPAVPPRPA